MARHQYQIEDRVTYTFCGGVPASVLCIELPGRVIAIAAKKVTVRLDNGLEMTVPANDPQLKEAA